MKIENQRVSRVAWIRALIIARAKRLPLKSRTHDGSLFYRFTADKWLHANSSGGGPLEDELLSNFFTSVTPKMQLFSVDKMRNFFLLNCAPFFNKINILLPKGEGRGSLKLASSSLFYYRPFIFNYLLSKPPPLFRGVLCVYLSFRLK